MQVTQLAEKDWQPRLSVPVPLVAVIAPGIIEVVATRVALVIALRLLVRVALALPLALVWLGKQSGQCVHLIGGSELLRQVCPRRLRTSRCRWWDWIWGDARVGVATGHWIGDGCACEAGGWGWGLLDVVWQWL